MRRISAAYVFGTAVTAEYLGAVDGLGIWLATRRLHAGGFVWAAATQGPHLSLSHEQLSALVLGLPWQRMGPAGIISVV